MHIPDTINSDELNELLAGKQRKLPAAEFNDDNPCELSLLIGLLSAQTSSDGAPTVGHMLHAALCLISTGVAVLSNGCAHYAGKGNKSIHAVKAVALATEMSTLAAARELLIRVIEQYGDRNDVTFDGAVSDAFLESIGVSRKDFEDFRKRSAKF